MGTLYEKLNGDTATKNRVKPFAPVSSSTPAIQPASLQLLRQNATSTPQTAAERMAIINRDRDRGLTISQGTPDPVQQQRQGLSGIPVIGQFLTGTGPQGPSSRLYPEGSMRQSLVEKGIVGFFLEGFQKAGPMANPTRKEVGEQIFTRYEKLQEIEKNPDRALQLAIQDTINESSGQAKNINDLSNPNIELSKEEKAALFWVNTLEDAFAVLDAPVFVGSTKIPKNALLAFLKKANKAEDIIPRLRMIGITEDVASEVAPKLAKSSNELEIARLIEDAKTAVKDSSKPSLFSRISDKVSTKLTPGRTSRFTEDARQASKIEPGSTPARALIKRADEVDSNATERFFRSTQGGKAFEEVMPDEVVPAFIREDLDTFVTKLGDEFQVIEGKTGQQIGDGGRSVAEAVQSAKSEVEALGNERLNEFLTNSPLSPRYTQVVEKAPETTAKEVVRKLPAGVTTADQLRLTDKAAARRLAKLENMAKSAPDVDSFVDNSGITREALDKTVQKQGYKDSEQFFNTNRPEKMSKAEAARRTRSAEPDTRAVPDDDQYYSLLAEQEAGDAFALAVKKDEAEAVVDNLRAVFADLKGIEVEDALKFTEEDLFKAQTEYEFIMDSLMDDPARQLVKYMSKTTGRLPEVTGKGTMMDLRGGKREVRNSEFGKRGDEILQEIFGYERQVTREEAQGYLEAYLKRKAAATEVLDNLRKVRNSIRMAKQMDTFVEVNQKKLAAEFMKNRKALTAIVEAAERAGFRKGMAKGNEKMEKLVNRLRSRRQTISGIKFRYNLSPSEVRKTQEAAQKEMKDLAIPDDPRFMTKDEFSEYVKQMEIAARDIELRRNERGMVKAIIDQKELKNTENLREAMGLPTLSEMTLEELGRFEKVLNKFRDGDEFLSKRTLEVIDRTALKGARTVRQVQEFLSQEIKRVLGRDVKPSELGELTAGAGDYLRWDTSLAESKPFYGFMVNRAQKHIMEGEANFLRIQSRIEDLAKKAKKSRVKYNANKIKQLKKQLRGERTGLQAIAAKSKDFKSFKEKTGELLYHGSKETYDELKPSQLIGSMGENQLPGIYLSPDYATSAYYAGRGRAPGEVRFKGKLLEVENFKSLKDKYGATDFSANTRQSIAKKVVADGYDGVKLKQGGEANEIIVFNTKAIKTEAQLKKIWDESQLPIDKTAIKKRMKDLGWRANAKQKIIPTYSRIINYLEARGDDKEMWFKTLTKEEQEYAKFIRNYYNHAYNYLSYINELHGSRYIDAYFTHVRKGFLEKWSDDGFVSAIKNMWDAQKEDMAIANIIDSDTGKILPKSKFFQYTLKRTGEGEVSQNLTRVFLQYSKLLERKKMLDKMVPELDVYTSSLTPKELTQRGLEMDRTMKEFVNNYLNNKRGRRFNYGGIVKQNGPADIMIRSGNTLVSFMDLGLNFLAGSASMVGEQVANFVALGNRGTFKGFKRRIWDTGMKRLVDPKAADILKQAEPFIGRNIWTEIAEVDKPIFEKAMQTMFGMFGQSSVEANKIYLLGSLTKEELKAGKISAQRMADLRLETGRWRDMGASVKSIVGATSPGSAYTKYKTWAIPIMRTTIDNLTKTAARLKKGNFKEALTAKETKELMRAVEVTALAIVVGNVIASEEDQDAPLAKLRARIKQEALTILGGVDPTVWLATPRLYSWMQQLAGNLKKIALLEEYKTDSKYGDKGDLKGIGGLKQMFTPGFIRQFIPDAPKKSTKEESKTGTKLDDLNRLDKLDGLNKLNSLDRLDKLDQLDSLDSL